MAKKKATNIENEEKELNTSSSTPVSYNGEVTIKLVNKNGKVIKSTRNHNDGNTPLFQFLSHCLKGEYNGNERPYYIMGYHNSGTPSASSLGTSAIYSLTPIADVQSKEVSGSYQTDFKFIIPASSVNTDTVITSTNKLNVFGLYNIAYKDRAFYGTNSSAYIKLTSAGEISASDLANGVSIVIVWSMTVKNS